MMKPIKLSAEKKIFKIYRVSILFLIISFVLLLGILFLKNTTKIEKENAKAPDTAKRIIQSTKKTVVTSLSPSQIHPPPQYKRYMAPKLVKLEKRFSVYRNPQRLNKIGVLIKNDTEKSTIPKSEFSIETGITSESAAYILGGWALHYKKRELITEIGSGLGTPLFLNLQQRTPLLSKFAFRYGLSYNKLGLALDYDIHPNIKVACSAYNSVDPVLEFLGVITIPNTTKLIARLRNDLNKTESSELSIGIRLGW